MPILTNADHDHIRQCGYLIRTDLLTPEELEHFIDIFDTDRDKCRYRWYPYGYHQSANYDALITSPAFDKIVRHPSILAAVNELMDGPTCFGEIGARHMTEYEGELHRSWHRDRPHWPEHRYRMDYIQCMLYLTDVGPDTHCFSISPEAVDNIVLKDQKAQIERGGIVDIHGPAGTVCLFNVAVLHTATTRNSSRERKTVQTYYGHRDRAPLANDSVIPPRLWKLDPDPETRAFYGNLNQVSQTYAEAFGVEQDSTE